MRPVERVTQNFINKYGFERFVRLLDLLGAKTSGQAIANEFLVSRERVRQWKSTFGDCIYIYKLKPEVQRVINEYARNNKSSS